MESDDVNFSSHVCDCVVRVANDVTALMRRTENVSSAAFGRFAGREQEAP